MKYVYSAVIVAGFLFTIGSIASQRETREARQMEASSRDSNQRQNPAHRVQAKEPLKLPPKDPRIIVMKSKRQLELYSNGTLLRTYRIGLGFNPIDDKKREGDGCTPEGDFYIFVKNKRSAYYLSVGISYPNSEDADRGLRDGLITKAEHDSIVEAIRKKRMPPQKTALGGEIYIHGNGANSDWTWGCVALDNDDIAELYKAVTVGTPVTIRP